ncbi:MAG TPA: hypothetical protein IAC04_04775 [Candidatus Coprenecus stercoravium]|uniref:SPOR domain-containing protein n=1 Tax=Candidatus Coprenecus stercoravium TaxID=2840735 RepID=A0A9D2GQX3_9BACT|nr:hypothetical protein [Candidatus Coprenecus stercoravium]
MTALRKLLIVMPALCVFCLPAYGQADIFHKNYQFDKAIELYENILDSLSSTGDSSGMDKVAGLLTQCQNGLNMMQYIVRPEPVAVKSVPVKEFFLYLKDLPDKSWIPVPNPFVKTPGSGTHPFYKAMYLPAGDTLVFSAPDTDGFWKIHVSYRKDSVTWTSPVILSETLVSGRNEIFPMMSRDGGTLYFASDGMPGMGGYDLFRSTWDGTTGTWSTPENLGFPYSSTGNDILFLNSSDGRYSIIVSDRIAEADSVDIFVTGLIATPVKTPLGRDESPVRIASLTPKPAPEAAAEKSETSRPTVDRDAYSDLMHELRSLRSEQRGILDKIDESRKIYETTSGDDRDFMASIINDLERKALNVRKRIDEASARVRKMEIQFLSDGIFPTEYGEPAPESSAEKPAAPEKYGFIKRNMGRIPYVVVEVPEPEFDYTFRILGRDKGQFAEDNTLPEGVVYQIQFAVLSSRASVRDIKGMTPVFVTRMPSGKYVHNAGLFRTYGEAQSALGSIRKIGFKDAFIVAYRDGVNIPVKTARTLEGRSVSGLSCQVVLRGAGESLPAQAVDAVRETCSKDITKFVSDGQAVFAVGPFRNADEARPLVSALQDLNLDNIDITIEYIKR